MGKVKKPEIKKPDLKNVNKKVIENLIYAGVFDSFEVNHHTLIESIDNAIRYSELLTNLDSSLIEKPIIESIDEYSAKELQAQAKKAWELASDASWDGISNLHQAIVKMIYK